MQLLEDLLRAAELLEVEAKPCQLQVRLEPQPLIACFLHSVPTNFSLSIHTTALTTLTLSSTSPICTTHYYHGSQGRSGGHLSSTSDILK